MKIVLNGFPETVPDGMTVAELIERVEEKDPNLIVEVNNRYIFPEAYQHTRISENDAVEFINPNFGG